MKKFKYKTIFSTNVTEDMNIMLSLTGVDLKSTSVAELEKITTQITPQKLHDKLNTNYGLGILATCNRFEIYLLSYSPSAHKGLLELFTQLGVREDKLRIENDVEAICHLIEVAAGIHSIAKGENEILTQVRNAEIYGSGLLKQKIRMLFRHAYNAGKKIREELNINNSNSLGRMAVQFLLEQLPDMDAKILVVGYGIVGKRVVSELRSSGLTNILVVTRNPDKVSGIRAVKLENLDRLLNNADAVIVATASRDYIITWETVRKLESGKRIIVIDLALPRNVEPSIAKKNSDIRIYNIEDLTTLAPYPDIPEDTIEKVKKLARAEALAIFQRLKALEAEAIIRSIRTWAEAIRIEEVSKTLRLLTGNVNYDKMIVEKLSQRIVNRILHGPTTAIRKVACGGLTEDYADIVKEIFGVEKK